MHSLIKINKNISNDLLTKGFCIVRGSEIKLNNKLEKNIIDFIKYYDNLEVDNYVLDYEGKPYRKRRYGNLYFDINNKKLIPNSKNDFYQSKEINKKYGGINRIFAPIEKHILNNRFLQELIKTDFYNFHKNDQLLSNIWSIGIHLFRIETTKEFDGKATPEGIHQDGHYIIAQHMINKKNIKGGGK